MAVATTYSVALQGAIGHLIEVQADVSPGLVGTTVVGRADTSLAEGRDRVRMAVTNSGLAWPSTKRVTVLLSPADLPKSGTHYDLAVAIAILAAEDPDFRPVELSSTAFIGELSLDGGLRPVTGVLPMALAASRRGLRRVVVPEPQAAEAMMVPGMEVLGMRSLAQVVAQLQQHELPDAPPVPEPASRTFLGWRGNDRLEELDLADLVGMADAKYALEVAAAGGHHLLLSGPKGCGKTSLAERIGGLLPDLDSEETVELMALRSLAGLLDPSQGELHRPPYSAPHHDASKPSLVGGGSGRVQPGLISLAHTGVLFMDEFPLFRTDVIDALREPLENGDITIARGEESVTLPARALVVLAANPCPCGNYGVMGHQCRCRDAERRDYDRRVRGPIVDRIDITRRLAPVSGLVGDPLASPEPSVVVRGRVSEARARQAERYAGERWRLNGHAPGAVLRQRWPMTPAAHALVDAQLVRGTLTRRGQVRVHRLAWTVADLAGVDRPGEAEADTALRLRNGDAVHLTALQRRAG